MDDYILVPKELTPEMKRAVLKYIENSPHPTSADGMYKAMLSAAPKHD